MADEDDIAQISVKDAARLSKMLRQWEASRGGNGNGTGGNVVGYAVPADIAWVAIGETPEPYSGETPVKWKYRIDRLPFPFYAFVDANPGTANPGNVVYGFNTAELGNSEDAVFHGDFDLIAEETANCGDVIGIEPVPLGTIVLATLHWTWIESNDPTDGYWAWWFTFPNKLKIKPREEA